MTRPTILIVDDNPLNLEVIKTILQKDYNLRIARDGQECINRAAVDPQPDLILLDIIMPVLDGYQTLDFLQNNDRLKEIPVIFLTAVSGKEEIVKGFAMGAVDYLKKPFNAPELLARVRTHLSLKFNREQVELQKKDLQKLNSQLKERITEQKSYIEKARLLQGNLIQKTIPLLTEYTIQALYLPCEDLGGDFFSIVKGIQDNKLVIILGDCTGHGVKASIDASLLTSIVQKELYNLFHTGDTARFLTSVNRKFIANKEEDQFPTLFVCTIDMVSRKLIYSNANGVLPSMIRKGKLLPFDRVAGMHIGYDNDTYFESMEILLQEGDRIYFFSDAILEYDAVKYNHTGRSQFDTLISKYKSHPTEDFQAVLSDLEKASGKFPLSDDTTLILLDFPGSFMKSYKLSTPDEIDNLIKEIQSVLCEKDYPSDTIKKVCIGLDEICLNAYYHGNKENPEKTITIDASIDCKELRFIVTDMGEGFYPKTVPDPVKEIRKNYESDNPEKFMHGRGIEITNMFYDKVEYKGNGNSVFLHKKKEEKSVLIYI